MNARTPLPVYTVMAVWMAASAVWRVLTQLHDGYPLDLVPIVSVTIAGSALLLLHVTGRPHAGLYLALAVWLPVGSVVRVLIQLIGRQHLDPVPAVSFVLGFAALTMFLFPPHHDDGARGVDGR